MFSMEEDDDNVLSSSLHSDKSNDVSNDANESSIQKEETVHSSDDHVYNNVTIEEEGRYNREGSSSTYLTMYGDHRVPSALAALPPWLQEYIAWNQNERATKDPKDLKYLVMKCTKSQKRCGGFSDRLRPLPFYLLMAQKTNRILCIYWDRPMRLESFLQVPKNGLDWTCPSDFAGDSQDSIMKLKLIIHMNEKVKRHALELVSKIKTSNETYTGLIPSQSLEQINCLNNIFHANSYQEHMPKVSKWIHIDLMEHIFRVMFKPIPAIARNINVTMTNLGLVEGNYTSIHLRARYPTSRLMYILGQTQMSALDKGHFTPTFDGKYKKYLTQLANNAVECGYLLDTKRPIVFISDSADLVDHVIENKMNIRGSQVHILGVKQRPNVIHIEYDDTNVEDTLYPLFEDLLIMGGGYCVAHGLGSFGAFGAGLAGNRCRALHRRFTGAPNKCPNNDTSIEFVPITNNELILD
ncbi:hypothetical protein CTEN210_00748 [Chaetoceros tenuissimus]|uniref:Uncharacterized protein n=1 Tax=Chaetoceros tenuissimus TaxID=426638 RepID=A0AAD3CER1_9STRA|nr:hypothetical protein CTEN210_00748 [Chaetoceros tenuissimus]